MSDLEQKNKPFTSNKPYLFRAVYQWILDNDATPYLLVDATQDKVQVPWEHVKDGQIVLNTIPSAIQNWYEDNDVISFSARFSGKAQTIYIPMNALLAVYAQENGMGMAFPDEMASEEVLSEELLSGEFPVENQVQKETQTLKEAPSAKVVAEVLNNKNEPSSKKKISKKSAPFLKVIK